MTLKHISTIQFGTGGNSDGYLGTGWSLAEDGFRWMIGPFSELTLGKLTKDVNYILILDVDPLVRPEAVSRQRLTLSIGGVPFAEISLTSPGKIGFRVPVELIVAGEDAVIVFDHPDAVRPSEAFGEQDSRPLAIFIRSAALYQLDGTVDTGLVGGKSGVALSELEQRVGLPPDQFIARFESLGENCEFGLVQRRCGAEPLSLLRFSNTLLHNLVRGLETGFKGLGEAGDLEFALEGDDKQEFIVKEKEYGLVYHTFRYKGEIDEAKFTANEPIRLSFLVRKFAEDLQAGEKILVCKRNEPLTEQEILPVFAAVSQYGDSPLLWVVLADEKHPPGSVQWVLPGLLKGYINRFAPNDNAHDLPLNVWLEICANAAGLNDQYARNL